MNAPRLLVVEHESDAGLGVLGDSLRQAGADLFVVGPGVGIAIPKGLDGIDGLIVLGGTPGPVDDGDAPWLPHVRALIRRALDDSVPYLGVCLGAQMLAVVAGGHVEEAVLPEVGLYPLAPTPAAHEDPLLGGVGADAVALQWHFLEVTRLPEGSVSLCQSERCLNQAFRVGTVAWGVQFHLEADLDTAIRWARPDDPNPDLAALSRTAADVVEPVRSAQAAMREQWSAVARRWLDVVKRGMLS